VGPSMNPLTISGFIKKSKHYTSQILKFVNIQNLISLLFPDILKLIVLNTFHHL